jgi:GT2 family glycosyltransferase/ADP-heptose:LPS heptosyltransferase
MYRSREVIQGQIGSWDLTDCGLSQEVIYVDDSCPNESYREVLESWDRLKHLLKAPVGKIVRNDRNGGYAHACNTGAKFASGKYLIFLNADTNMTPGWVKPMVDAIEADPAVGMVGNMHLKMRNGRPSIDSAGSEWCWRVGSFEHVGRHIYHGQPLAEPMYLEGAPEDIVTPGYRDMVTGCCFLMRAELYERLGGFDTGYRVGYWEDSDLNMKVKRAGYRVLYEPRSRIYHMVGHSGSGGHAFMQNNRERFYNKWVNSGVIDEYVSQERPIPFVLNSAYIKRAGAHGDVLVAAAVAAAIKKKHPGCVVTFDTDVPEVLRGNPHIDHVVRNYRSMVEFQVKYDLNLSYESAPKRPILDVMAEAANVDPADCEFFFHTEPYDGLPDRYVVLAAGQTAWVGRNWHADKFNEVARGLVGLGYHVVAVGNSVDATIPLPDVTLDLRGKTSIYQLGHVIKNATLFVGIDSFPMWVAQAFNVPGVSFFGCVRPELRIVRDNMVGVNAAHLPCIGCHHDQPAPATGLIHCKVGGTPCEDLGAEKVLAEVIKSLAELDNLTHGE